jgi:hypothetical protein
MSISKKQELENPNSCLNRSRDDEPVFVLCGRDRSAPTVIEFWATLADHAGVPLEKVKAAREEAVAMRQWQSANYSKVPD